MNRFTSIAALTAILLTTAACGDDTASPVTAAIDTAAVDTAATTTTQAVPDTSDVGDQVPQAIVSLSPTATEMLFAIGAGQQVIAVDEYSDFPAEALQKPHDLSGYEPSIEAIAALEPDLVVLQGPSAQEALEALGIEVWIGEAAETFDDVYAQIEQLGAITGHIGEAAELVGEMQVDIEAALASAPVTDSPLTYYHELDPTLFSVTSRSFIGEVYALFGLVNIADGADSDEPYLPLSAEYIISSAPDLVFLADTKCCGESAGTAAA